MTGPERFSILVVVSFFVFVGVLSFVVRRRGSPSWSRRIVLALVVVVGGMLFARWGQNSGLPWWIYYTTPALATFLAPPLLLRMSRRETVEYLAIAIFMAPVIHLFFGFFVGWSDYMPFIPVRSLKSLLHG
jgi:hypothetical protein